MELRDAYRRPEVISFFDARMLGAFVSTSRSAKLAARECDAWQAVARHRHERPAYFGGEPGSADHMRSLDRLFHAPEYYGQPDGSIEHLLFISHFVMPHSRFMFTLDGDEFNGDPEMEIDYRDCRPLRNMTIYRLPDRHPHVLLIGRDRPVDD